MEFADGVVRAAWDRQGGRCAKCGRWLIWAQRGRESMTGAWQPHHRNPHDNDKHSAVANCIIFCSSMADCHFKEGHEGIDWSHHACLDDSRLLFLRAGEEAAERTPTALSGEKKGSLIGAFLGISQVTPSKRRGTQKRKTSRKPRSRARADDASEGASEPGIAADQ